MKPAFAVIAVCAARCAGTADRPRLAVFRSNRGIFAQLIDDDAARTLASASWLDLEVAIGEQDRIRPPRWARRSPRPPPRPGSRTCVFDRGGYLYHGRVKALADGAREGGLQF